MKQGTQTTLPNSQMGRNGNGTHWSRLWYHLHWTKPALTTVNLKYSPWNKDKTLACKACKEKKSRKTFRKLKPRHCYICLNMLKSSQGVLTPFARWHARQWKHRHRSQGWVTPVGNPRSRAAVAAFEQYCTQRQDSAFSSIYVAPVNWGQRKSAGFTCMMLCFVSYQARKIRMWMSPCLAPPTIV